MGFYFEENGPFLHDDARAYFAAHNVKVVPFERANSIGIDGFFDNPRLHSSYFCIPRSDWINIPIPYGPDEHWEHEINGVSIEKVIEDHIAQNFSKRKFMFSGRPDYYFAIEFEVFSYELFSYFYSGHLNSTFCLFDDLMNKAIFFELDLSINTYTRLPSLADERLGELDDEVWVNYFNEKFLSGISYNKHHISLINDLYRPVIPSLRHFD